MNKPITNAVYNVYNAALKPAGRRLRNISDVKRARFVK